ncbi:MAG: potassium-transporting ATPase subunit KdpC [Deltaproteobacteria bacterium]|nr:potassium-transporting ATPase subunit KdpC [Deltaproteobacteria bacterium]
MKDIKPAILLLTLFTVICGGLYPAVVTGLAQTFFPEQAHGSFIKDQTGRVAGSELIGQPFSTPEYFWPRPSATGEFAYNPLASSGSNAGPTNPAYLKTVGERLHVLREAGLSAPLAADLAQASASGLDPHISPAAAQAQIPRIARARGLNEEVVATAVTSRIEGKQLGFLGAERVNVLALNLQLDTMSP